jgi:DNA-binding response OmpR family regulator
MTTVLVVDDDPDTRDLIIYKLERSEFTARAAIDGEAALKEVAREVPGLVILDIMMPGLSGLDVLEQWRAAPSTSRLPVILLSGKTQEEDVDRGFALGADDYLVKPFSPRELVRRVNAVLARSRP